jgi:hypothetical protein
MRFISCFFSHFSQKSIWKMVLSHYTLLDRLSPINPSESGIGAGGGQVGRIRVQPHHVSKDKKPILDYDSSNDDFEDQDFNDSDTPAGQAAIQHFDDFISHDGYENDMNVDNNHGGHRRIYDDFAVSPEQGLVDDFTIVTQENSGRFSRVTGGRHGM